MRWSPTIAVAAAVAALFAAPAASQGAELLRDGGFEAGISSSPWAQADRFATTPLCNTTAGVGVGQCGGDAWPGRRAAPRSGSWWSWFGGYSLVDAVLNVLNPIVHTGSVRQSVTLAPGTPATLSFWLWIGRGDDTSVLNVSLGDHVVFATNGDDARYRNGYARVVVPISSSIATGAPQVLSFDYTGLVRLGPYPVFNVDDVSLEVADADLGVAVASTPAAVTQGATFTSTFSVGNSGPHDATEVTTQYPLPAGATLVGIDAQGAACSAPATAPGHVMHCDFGTVPAGTARNVTVALRADAVGTVAQAVTTAHRTGDPNPANQVAHTAVTVVAPAAPPPPPPPKQDDEKDEDEDEEQETCTAPRRFTVPLARGRKGSGLMLGDHRPARSRITSARLSGPKKFKAPKLRYTRSRVTLDLRRVPAGKYTLRTRVRVSSKRTIAVNKTFTACGPETTAKAKRAKKPSGSKSSSKSKSTRSKSAKAKASSRT